jgi:hypothetical protein
VAAIALGQREVHSDPAGATTRLEGVLARAHGKDAEGEADALLALASVARQTRRPEAAAKHLETLFRDHPASKAAGKSARVLRPIVLALPAAN